MFRQQTEPVRPPLLPDFYKPWRTFAQNMYKDTDITFLATLKETLALNPDASQRDIAQNQEISLGMTNAVLSRLAQKGWILMQRLDGRKIRYVLTPTGMAQLAERSSAYMKRTFEDMHLYGSAVANRIQNAKTHGLTNVVLYGKSNLDFLIEYACRMFELKYSACDISELQKGVPSGTYGIVGELSSDALSALPRDADAPDAAVVTAYELAG